MATNRGNTLTPYDTGKRLQPNVYPVQPCRLPDVEEADRFGRVDFDLSVGRECSTVHGGGSASSWMPLRPHVLRDDL